MTEVKPVVYDLGCGLGGFTEGFLAEGWRCIGYDIEAHEYGDHKYPGELRLESILDLDGSELADAAVIVASPPCQEFSYMAMPWKRGKQIAAALRGYGEFPAGYTGSRTVAELRALFDACFRIQREASTAAGRHIPLVVENVKGAEPWVGPAAWHFDSFYLWGDVPALMPPIRPRAKVPGQDWNNFKNGKPVAAWNDSAVAMIGAKGGSTFRVVQRPQNERRLPYGSSRSPARKAASALIAKIPLELSNHIARVYAPRHKYELPA